MYVTAQCPYMPRSHSGIVIDSLVKNTTVSSLSYSLEEILR